MKEAYAIHYAINKLHYYLHNSKFVVKTDHLPLKFLLNSEQKNRRLQAWSLTIGSYNCEIQYLKGDENVCADLLSRRPNDDKKPQNDNDTVEEEIPIISDMTFEVAALNSNTFEPKEYLTAQTEAKSVDEPLPKLENFDMSLEQGKDEVLMDIKGKLDKGTAKRVYITNTSS